MEKILKFCGKWECYEKFPIDIKIRMHKRYSCINSRNFNERMFHVKKIFQEELIMFIDKTKQEFEKYDRILINCDIHEMTNQLKYLNVNQ